jgi:hypothetical protein
MVGIKTEGGKKAKRQKTIITRLLCVFYLKRECCGRGRGEGEDPLCGAFAQGEPPYGRFPHQRHYLKLKVPRYR